MRLLCAKAQEFAWDAPAEICQRYSFADLFQEKEIILYHSMGPSHNQPEGRDVFHAKHLSDLLLSRWRRGISEAACLGSFVDERDWADTGLFCPGSVPWKVLEC